MLQEAPSLQANGDIRPARFIKIDSSANQSALEANAGEVTFGISTEATKEAPQTGASTLAAADGDQFRYHRAGEICLLTIDSSGCTAGNFLKSDADGQGDVAAAGEIAGAYALETVSGGEKCLVMVLPPQLAVS